MLKHLLSTTISVKKHRPKSIPRVGHVRYTIIAAILLCAIGISEIRIDGVLRAANQSFSEKGFSIDPSYQAKHDQNILDHFGVGVRHANASADYRDREYQVTVGPIAGSVSANYVYASLFNPASSGRTVKVKRLMVRANTVAAANYVNLTVRRVTAATGGTQIATADIPKKNTDSTDSIAEVRHTDPIPTFAGSADSRIMGQPMPGAAGNEYSVREIVFSDTDEPIVLQQGEGLVVYQEAAGDADQRIQATFEWEEVTSVPVAQNEYILALPRVENAAGVNYVYNTFFNPATATKSAIIKRIWFGSETCDGAAVYTNNVVIRRISAASGGTLVTATNIPKKHTGSSDSGIVIRHTGVTATAVGGADARLLAVTPCGAVGEEQGWMNFDTRPADEQIVIRPGEGIALMSDTAGNANQLNRMFVEWGEVPLASTPAAEGEYLWSSSRVEVAAALGTTFYTAYNPAGSGRTALVKRIVMRVNADLAATYSTFNVQRISTSTGGTLIAATDIPKKHASSSNSVVQMRWCGAACASAITTTYVGGRSIAVNGLSDSGIVKALGPGEVGQLHGQQEIVFVPNEPLVLRQGEGIGMYLNYLAGDADHYIRFSVEWAEVVTPPVASNRYAIDIGAMPGSAGASNNYAAFFNPAASGKTAIVTQVAVRTNAVAAATYSPIQMKRISAASGGTLIAAANVPRKDTSASTSIMNIRYTAVTATYSQSVDAQLLAVQTPGAIAGPTALARTGSKSLLFENDEPIILQPGEGIVLNNNAAADVDHRLYWYLEWEEVATSSTPVPEGDLLMTIGPAAGSLTSGYVYATLFNPATSSKLYTMSRVGIRANRINTLAAPGNITVAVRRITAASGGTVVSTANIPEKHSSSSTTTAEIRYGGVTTAFANATSSRLLSIVAPGVVQQSSGILEKEFVFNDELVLFPGEGIALYQETNAGDGNVRYYLTAQWKEGILPDGPPYITMSISDNSIGFGPLSSFSSRYATGDVLGTSTINTVAHNISASTNAAGGYLVTLSGTTLSYSSSTINPIGAVALSPAIGAEQFGVQFAVASGTGSVAAPYGTTSQYAFATSSFPDTVATGVGDDVSTIFNASYVANVGANTEAGTYSARLMYLVTGTF